MVASSSFSTSRSVLEDEGADAVLDEEEEGDDPDCRDDRPNDCPSASHRGECWTMWEATMPACRSSCWLCVNATELRLRNVTEDEIRRRRKYSRIDFGPLPSFPAHPNPRPEVLRTQHIVAAMDVYARQFPQHHCVNGRAECPYWAALDQCRTNYDYMIQECPLACRYCDQRAHYLRCRDYQNVNAGPNRQRKRLPLSHITQWKEWLLSSDPDFRARNVLEVVSTADHEWAVLLESFVPPDEREEIRWNLLRQLEFQPSVADGYDIHDTLPLHSQSDPDVPQIVRRTSASAHCDLRCIQQSPALQLVLKRLLKLLHVPSTAYLEKPVEFVSYGPHDTFARHSDCRVHDAWKGGGYRAVAAYVALDGSEETTMGFSHFWEMVPVREGQLLVWPNARMAVGDEESKALKGDGVECNKNMTSEVLASPGTSWGMVVHVRLYPVDESTPAECR